MNQLQLPTGTPYAVLGIGLNEDDERIRAAYLARLKQFPPDRSPAEFERVRDAYELLRDRRKRAEYMLFSFDAEQPLESLLGSPDDDRRFAGPDAWLAVLKGK